MSSGFNTDVRVGDQIFHVQTEDRGPSRPVVDTAVYQNGRVLHRRSSSYEQYAASVEFTAEGVRQRVEDQHRAVIQELRSGALPATKSEAQGKREESGGIQVQLLNPQSWLSAGRVSLDLEILHRAGRQPRPGVKVEAGIEGAAAAHRHAAKSDELGRVRIHFPLPPLGKGDLTLVILASADGDHDEIRLAMRSGVQISPSGAGPSSKMRE
jgi:hypothetical protein